jgi:ornithine decarboxylase
MVRQLTPQYPVHILRTDVLKAKASEFLSLFPGTVMYAVKCNPDKAVLQTLYKAGIKTFDVASIDEVRLVRKTLPKARIHFMHTVKSPESIREAYFQHGVRVFVLDTIDELYKIMQATELANDLDLFVRIALPKNTQAALDFSIKFGAKPDEAPELLRQTRLVSRKCGVMFHPGSQSLSPDAFRRGIRTAAKVIKDSGIAVDAIDVGGGFPASYPGAVPPPLSEFISEIRAAIKSAKLDHLELYCEPGRALAAEAGSLIVRVELRKGNTLYLNDGVYGGMVEAAKWGGFRFPCRLIRQEESTQETQSVQPAAFRFNGPTCDSLDMMEGPFALPGDVKTGDWIEVGNLGAYSAGCRTNFNGFGKATLLVLRP